MGSDGGILGTILNPVMNLLFGEPPQMPEPPPLPSFPDPPSMPQERSAEEKEAERLRRVQARKTGGNPNVLTTPLGATGTAPTQQPKLLGK